MIGNDVSILTVRTCDEDGTFLIAMFGDGVGGTSGARTAGEGQLIRWFLGGNLDLLLRRR